MISGETEDLNVKGQAVKRLNDNITLTMYSGKTSLAGRKNQSLL